MQFLAGVVRGQLIPSEREVKSPRKFTSVIKTTAKPDMVIGTDGKPVAGQKGAKGEYELKINTHEDTVCYKIVLDGMTGDYFAPAKTATHVHEGASGATGPPRLAFKNPQSSKWSKWGWNKNRRTSEACIKGPFSTGLTGADGKDTGSQSGFTLEQLEKNPKGFFADTHTVRFAAGVVRGQLRRHRKH